jgi:hypothetical protein
LSSRLPEVDVPLPLGLDFIPLSVVGDELGVAELAAGSPVLDPRPLGPPGVCAKANEKHKATAEADTIVARFIASIPSAYSTKPIG